MKISIITPSFNQGLFIEKTIQSVITQNYSPLDFIVVDGGSTDQTLGIIKKYQSHLSWISEPDKGQSHAVNKGMTLTTGDIIGWLNSDDIYYPQTIPKVCDFFAKHPDVDVLYGDAHYIDHNDEFIYAYPTERWSRKRILSCCFIAQPATFFRRRVLEKYGLLDESLQFCMDYEFWLRMSMHSARFVYFPHVLAGSRRHSETKTSRFCLQASVEAITMLQKKVGYIPSEWLINYSSAIVKSSSNLHYPQIRFIVAVWLNLWKSSSRYYQGLKRIHVWSAAQLALAQRFLRKMMRIHNRLKIS